MSKTKLSCQLIYYKLLLLFLSCCLISCNNPIKPDTRARVLVNDDDRFSTPSDDRNVIEERSSRVSCRERTDSVFILGDLDTINSNNVGNYLIKGRCQERKQAVIIKINGYRISEDPSCSRGRFESELDLSSVASSETNILIEVSHNKESVCQEVRVGFLGPKNYIPVPSREDYYESSFYVMKYEAKVENKGNTSAKAISKPEDKPITRVSYNDALKLCKNNGPHYDLIQNSQWQNIALSIEETDINWSRGRRSLSDDNALNCGVSLGRAKPANADDQNDCADSSCQSQWDFKRRTHILNNGEIIWDFCGNVGEIMKDRYTLSQSFDAQIFELTGQLKQLFGPERTYKTGTDRNRSRRDNYYWGLGEADIDSDHDLIVRGGTGRSANGIFSVSVKNNQDGRRTLNQLGFRCVYEP